MTPEEIKESLKHLKISLRKASKFIGHGIGPINEVLNNKHKGSDITKKLIIEKLINLIKNPEIIENSESSNNVKPKIIDVYSNPIIYQNQKTFIKVIKLGIKSGKLTTEEILILANILNILENYQKNMETK